MSQAASILPGSPLTGATAAADINASMAAIISKFSGSLAPPLGPGVSQALVVGQDWLDTSVTPNVWRKWDGSQWCPFANLDPTLHAAGIALPWRNIMGANGGFEVWQRGTGNSSSFAINASTTAYTADRWYITTGANEASTIAAIAGLTNLSNLAAKITRNSGQTGTTVYTFGFPLDTDELVRMHGNRVSIAAAVKAGANWSPASGTVNITLYVGTGAVAKRGGGFSGETNVASASVNLSPSQQSAMSATSSATVPTTTTQGELQFTWTPVGTAGADDSIAIDDVQLEVGGMSSPFERMPLDMSLMLCKRHFWKTFLYGTAPAQNIGINTGEIQVMAAKAATGASFVTVRNPVSMRTTPAITSYNPAAGNAQMRDETANADGSATNFPNLTSETVEIAALGNASTAVGNIMGIHVVADAGI